MSGQLTPAQFVSKWSKVTLPERAASQEHFIDLCRMLAQPTPAEHDATDRQIDQLVDEYYALTHDEIRIVEEATANHP